MPLFSRFLLASFLLLGASAVLASEEPPAELDAVEVEGLRNPQVFEMQRGIEVREKFRALPADKRDALSLNFYLSGKGKNAPEDLASVQLVIDTSAGYLDVPVDTHGRLSLPEVPSDLVKKSELFSDQPKRSLEIVYKVDIAADGENAISVAQARRGVGQARSAWKAILPGLARATVPKFNCIEFQFRGAGAVSADDAPLAAGESIKLPLADIPAGAQQLTWSGDLSRLAACKE